MQKQTKAEHGMIGSESSYTNATHWIAGAIK